MASANTEMTDIDWLQCELIEQVPEAQPGSF